MSPGLVFLKLGGSLITVKDQPHTPRSEVIERLAYEIAGARAQAPNLQILLGHGSGSYGHTPASLFNTRMGVRSSEEWLGFIEVWRQAAELNRLVMQTLKKAGLPVLVFPPSAMITTRERKIVVWNLEPIRAAIDNGLLPVIYGDAVFDQTLGGTILSTEDLLCHLAHQMQPSRMLFAGSQPGVWLDFPDNTRLLSEITPAHFPQISKGLKGSSATDVTGGMQDKVHQVIALIDKLPGIRASIFSGETPGNLRLSLLGEELGTVVHSS